MLWHFIAGRHLNGAYDALVDVKLQTEIDKFSKFIDKTKSIQNVEQIFTIAEQHDLTKKIESLCTVHKQMRELIEGDNFT